MYYIYKITLKKSPCFYIGVTCDFQNRKCHHHYLITKIIFCFINKESVNFPHVPADYKIAEFIYPLVRRFKKPEDRIKDHYSITVLRRSKDFQEVKDLETRYIRKDNPHSLNVRKESYYNKEDMKEKFYVIRGNNKSEQPCVVKITFGNRYVIAKMKTQAAGLKRIEDAVNAFMRGGANKPEGLYHHLFNYIKRQPQHKFKVQTLLFSDSPYQLLKKEQEELDFGRGNPNFLNNQVEAYLPQYNEEKKMYGGWIPQVDVLNFRNWMKNRKKKHAANKTAV